MSPSSPTVPAPSAGAGAGGPSGRRSSGALRLAARVAPRAEAWALAPSRARPIPTSCSPTRLCRPMRSTARRWNAWPSTRRRSPSMATAAPPSCGCAAGPPAGRGRARAREPAAAAPRNGPTSDVGRPPVEVATQHCALLYNGRPALLVTVTDQTERRRAEQDLAADAGLPRHGRRQRSDRHLRQGHGGRGTLHPLQPDRQRTGRPASRRASSAAPTPRSSRPRSRRGSRPRTRPPSAAANSWSSRRRRSRAATARRGSSRPRSAPSPDAADGRMRYLLGIAEDITERRALRGPDRPHGAS